MIEVEDFPKDQDIGVLDKPKKCQSVRSYIILEFTTIVKV
jgi:hypothetical protein